jgi:hypothetical protein
MLRQAQHDNPNTNYYFNRIIYLRHIEQTR